MKREMEDQPPTKQEIWEITETEINKLNMTNSTAQSVVDWAV